MAAVAAPAITTQQKQQQQQKLSVRATRKQWWPREPDTPWEALVAARMVEIRHTGTDRGLGVFARVAIPQGTHLGVYRGEPLTWRQFRRRYGDAAAEYTLTVHDDLFLDARDRARANWVSFANDARGTGQPMNTEIPRGTCAMRAVRDIAPGDELLYDYGQENWDDHPVGALPLLK